MNADYLVGTVLDNRYEILEMIGSGGMATVYKAKCRVLNRFVAIKVLKDSFKYDADVVKRFNAESRAAARLSHPNIVQVYDVSETGGLDYIVMEYVDGITLKDYIKRRGVLPWKEARDFAIQIGKALECAHKNHIIHKDIKPHNVLLKRDGMIKVADFGIAQAVTTETRVADSSNLGSVHYISPEQGRGGYVDERSDIYSLGVVLYEMLTGKLPFDGANAVAIALMKLEKEPEDCRKINPSIPDSIARIVMKAMSKEQFARYQTAGEMVADLETLNKSNIKPIMVRHDNPAPDKRGEALQRIEERRRRKEQESDNAKRVVLTIVAVILAFVAVFAIGTLAFKLLTKPDKQYTVPNVENMTLEEAQEALKAADMEVEVIMQESAEVAEGHVIGQSIPADTEVKGKRKIKIYVSSGVGENDVADTVEEDVKEVSVPKVTNMSKKDAEELLEKNKLKAEITYKEHDSIEENNVISQSPAAGEKIKEGSVVKLVVSEGDGKVSVPNLSGYTKEKAETELKNEGLVLGEVTEQENAAEKGTVVGQSVSAGSKTARGTKVNLTVSKGLPKKTLIVTIPDDSQDIVHIKVVANDKTIHDKDHKKSEETVDIEVQAHTGAQVNVKVYIDGKAIQEKIMEF